MSQWYGPVQNIMIITTFTAACNPTSKGFKVVLLFPSDSIRRYLRDGRLAALCGWASTLRDHLLSCKRELSYSREANLQGGHPDPRILSKSTYLDVMFPQAWAKWSHLFFLVDMESSWRHCPSPHGPIGWVLHFVHHKHVMGHHLLWGNCPGGSSLLPVFEQSK